jgi:coproporphyrinogen III oxidase-like Fe-S oxidoreductase
LPDIKGYIQNLSTGDDAPFECEKLNESELLDEFIMLSLRTSKGILIADLKQKCGEKVFTKVEKLILKYIDNQYGEISPEGYFYFTTKGFIISDYLISEILSKLDD